MICAPDGGVIDDLIVYRLADGEYLVVANASNAATVAAELTERAGGRGAAVTDRTADYALIAIQGPRSAGILASLTDTDLDQVRYYASYPATVAGADALLARTGYTGEDGFELFVAPPDAVSVWQALTDAGQRRRAGPGRPGGPGLAPARGGHAAVRQRARPGRHAVRRRARPGRQARQAGRFRRPRRSRRAGQSGR